MDQLKARKDELKEEVTNLQRELEESKRAHRQVTYGITVVV